MLENPDRWTNVDLCGDVGADIVADLRTENPFKIRSAEKVYCSHCLEHFALGNAYQLLRWTAGWLVPGGMLWLAVPDFPSLAVHYIMGEWATELYDQIAGHGTHLSQWTRAHLALALKYAGFDILRKDTLDEPAFEPMAASPAEEGGQLDSSRQLSIRFVAVRNCLPVKMLNPLETLTPQFGDPRRLDDIAVARHWYWDLTKRQTARHPTDTVLTAAARARQSSAKEQSS